MLVRALKSFGSSLYGHRPEGSVFELPEGVDWLNAGLVEPVGETMESATVEASESAVKATPKKRTTRGRRKKAS